MERITFRCPSALRKAAEYWAEQNGYPNFSAYLREMLRQNVPDAQISRYELHGHNVVDEARPDLPNAHQLRETAEALQRQAKYHSKLAVKLRDHEITPEEARTRLMEGADE